MCPFMFIFSVVYNYFLCVVDKNLDRLCKCATLFRRAPPLGVNNNTQRGGVSNVRECFVGTIWLWLQFAKLVFGV